MKKRIKAKWLKWLRDPKNTQARSALWRKNDAGAISHCCLGGLYKCETGRNAPKDDDGFRSDAGLLSVQMLERVGMTDEEQRTLAEMNDKDFLSFVEIADWIERDL